MTTSLDIFDAMQAALASGGVDGVLQQVADTLLTQRRFHDVFEVRKM